MRSELTPNEKRAENGRVASPEMHSFTFMTLTLFHSEWPKLYGVLAILSAIGLM